VTRHQPKSNGTSSTVATLIRTTTLKREHEQAFLSSRRPPDSSLTEEEPGTLLYVLHRHPTEPHTYVWVERYRDREALSAHTEAAYIAEAMGKLANWLAKPPEMTELTQIVPADPDGVWR
jgi:quinol monooxygenase YgiN